MGLVIYSNAGGDGGLLLAKPSLPCKSITAKEKDKAVYLTWEDPDSPEDTSLYSEWASTRIVRKEGAFPVDENDGIVVLMSVTKNEYKDAPYVDSGLTNGTTYYYRAFTCSVDGVYNTADSVELSATPRPFRTMTVTIDLNDSNPETCGSYADDAISMPYGKTKEAINAWQEFFGYRPCLFKDGQVVGYLNPNDYTKFENGEPADITSGNAGDVMVEFPRRGLKISKSGKIITVSMTDNPDDPDFTYYAHTRISTRKDYFYLGAYRASTKSGSTNKIIVSLSNSDVVTMLNIEDYTKYAHNKGTGYEQMTWFQWLFIQVMYVLEFKGNLNSQSTVGDGDMTATTRITGSLDQKGLIYGTHRDYNFGEYSEEIIKLFGLEDLWGGHWTFVECIYMRGEFVEVLKDPSENGVLAEYDIPEYGPDAYGFITDVIGSSEFGFFPIKFDGSDTTYFCDGGDTSEIGGCAVGSTNSPAQTIAGIFCVGIAINGSYQPYDSTLGARISYY